MIKNNKIVATNFLRNIITDDLKNKKHPQIITRFPPEPNGYLHIGHAKSICLNFGLAKEFNGKCNLRFDDTNPENESKEYIESIKDDLNWLGFSYEQTFASDYFDELYQYAIYLIKQKKAFVCDLSVEETREYRGDLHNAGKDSPYRERSIEENLNLFKRMKNGEFKNGTRTLRAKIDMQSPNLNLRDPVLYRIKNISHHQTGDKWSIYPSYDFTHGQSDAIENITHSFCTLEFEDHKPLYEWFLNNLPVPSKPKQYEFSRLNLNYTITSKRQLKQLVEKNIVNGWDDPRMSTIKGYRRRGYTPKSIINFCEMIGINRASGTVDISMLEFAIREDLDASANRAMCVLKPLKVTIENFNEEINLTLPKHPKKDLGERVIPFTKVIYIDENDFQINPEKGYKRLSLDQEVRLRGSYVLKVEKVIKQDGKVIEIKATIDKNTLGKNPEGRKVKGVIHWVSEKSLNCEVRLYDRLIKNASPNNENFLNCINENSLTILKNCKAEMSLKDASLEERFQFEREGYFCLDKDSTENYLIFNRTVTLKDSWGK